MGLLRNDDGINDNPDDKPSAAKDYTLPDRWRHEPGDDGSHTITNGVNSVTVTTDSLARTNAGRRQAGLDPYDSTKDAAFDQFKTGLAQPLGTGRNAGDDPLPDTIGLPAGAGGAGQPARSVLRTAYDAAQQGTNAPAGKIYGQRYSEPGTDLTPGMTGPGASKRFGISDIRDHQEALRQADTAKAETEAAQAAQDRRVAARPENFSPNTNMGRSALRGQAETRFDQARLDAQARDKQQMDTAKYISDNQVKAAAAGGLLRGGQKPIAGQNFTPDEIRDGADKWGNPIRANNTGGYDWVDPKTAQANVDRLQTHVNAAQGLTAEQATQFNNGDDQVLVVDPNGRPQVIDRVTLDKDERLPDKSPKYVELDTHNRQVSQALGDKGIKGYQSSPATAPMRPSGGVPPGTQITATDARTSLLRNAPTDSTASDQVTLPPSGSMPGLSIRPPGSMNAGPAKPPSASNPVSGLTVTPAAAVAPATKGGTVVMLLPDGTKRPVPLERVEAYKKLGAKLV